MTEAHNAHAGQGPVLLDIGDDVGALIVFAPRWLAGQEIEARPIDRPALAHPPHAAVLGRPTRTGVTYCAVIADLTEGVYLLRRRPNGPILLRVTVTGGEVAAVHWPVGPGRVRAGRAGHAPAARQSASAAWASATV